MMDRRTDNTWWHRPC